MEYLYFKSEKGNFGDDLNPWLWPQLINEGLYENSVFLGIGSILYNENPNFSSVKDKRKIVFGAGIRPSRKFSPFKIDSSWDIRFLRGPLSSYTLNKNHKFISDAAYALRQLPDISRFLDQEKKYKISVMPYFRSVDEFKWKNICDQLGFHFISPYAEKGVEFTLLEIASSKFLISEAMHGAILADVLRVPWHRFILTTPFTEGSMVSEYKWMDWLFSIEKGSVNSTYIPYYRKTFANDMLKRLTLNVLNSELLLSKRTVNDIYSKLDKVQDFFLSESDIIDSIDEKIKREIYIANTNLGM